MAGMAAKPGPSGIGAMAMGPAAVGTTTQEYTVRVPNPKERKKKLSMMRFPTRPGVDFSKVNDLSVKMERENNLKEFKTANDMDMMPKFGAGSEYGRDLKETARRKKYGIVLKKYNPEDQPWSIKLGSGKQAKKYRGVREGTITENTSYYIFTQCADGAFEAFPVEEWYNFTPVIKYKYLNSEEAEEEFSRRDKTLNYFNIMLKKRVKNETKDAELDEEEKVAKKAAKSKKKNKDFMLTDMDEWADISDDDDEERDDDDEDREDRNKDDEKKKKKKASKKPRARVKNSKQNSDDEAIEESDEGDFDDREVDYMSDSSSSGQEDVDGKDKKNDEKGVAEEAGLRNILNSDDEDEDEENKDEDDNFDDDKKDDDKPSKDKKGSDSSSSSSGSDSDIDKDEKITSALLMQKDKGDKKKSGDKGDKADKKSDSAESKSLKRKADGDGPPSKKSKKDHSAYSGGSSSDGITEDSIRRYLQRKPMTTKDLLQKFRSKKLNLTNDQMTHAIAQLLKRINPERITINKKLYLSLKKPE